MSIGQNHSEQHLWQAAGQGFELLFQSASGYEVIRDAGGLLALTGVAAPDLNCGVVWAAGGAATAARTLADELRGRGLPGILLVPDAGGCDALDALPAEGMIAAARMPLMTRTPSEITADLRFLVRQARSPSDLEAANRLTAAAFELSFDVVQAAFRPSLLGSGRAAVELVLDGDEPVGSLQTTTHDELFGIWSMATPPTQRRRGIARAGLSQVLARRFADNASLAFLIATEAGRPLYDALGFQVVAWSTAWLVPPRDSPINGTSATAFRLPDGP